MLEDHNAFTKVYLTSTMGWGIHKWKRVKRHTDSKQLRLPKTINYESDCFYITVFMFAFLDMKGCDLFGICRNGGVCFKLIGSYSCQCTVGWTGKNCTEGMHCLCI